MANILSRLLTISGEEVHAFNNILNMPGISSFGNGHKSKIKYKQVYGAIITYFIAFFSSPRCINTNTIKNAFTTVKNINTYSLLISPKISENLKPMKSSNKGYNKHYPKYHP